MKKNLNKLQSLEQRQLLAALTVPVTSAEMIEAALKDSAFVTSDLPHCLVTTSNSTTATTVSAGSTTVSSFSASMTAPISLVEGNGTPNTTTVSDFESSTGIENASYHGAKVYGDPLQKFLLSRDCASDLLAKHAAIATHYESMSLPHGATSLALEMTEKTALDTTVQFIDAAAQLFTTYPSLTFSDFADYITKGDFNGTAATAPSLEADIQGMATIANNKILPTDATAAKTVLSQFMNIATDSFYAVVDGGKSILVKSWISKSASAPTGSVPFVSPTATPSISASATPSISASATPSISASATPSISASATPSISASATPSISPSSTSSSTSSISPSATPMPTLSKAWADMSKDEMYAVLF